MGECKSNIANLLKKSGKISIKRNTRLDQTVIENYVPCIHCGSFYYFKTLYKHQKNCFMKSKSTDADKANHGRVNVYALKSSRAVLDGALSDRKFEDVHRLLLSGMNRDELYIVIRNDQSLLLFAAAHLNRTEKGRYGDIRYSLRSLARLLKFREISEQSDAKASDLVMCENFDMTVKAAQLVSGYKGPREIKTPSVMLKSGLCLRNLAEYLRSQALKNCDKIVLNKLRNFLELYETDWQIYATNARATAEDKKAYAPEELPQERDIKIFRKYILEEIVELTAKVKSDMHKIHVLRKLAKFTLARVLTFNARRGGEVSKLKLRHWEGVENDRYCESCVDAFIDLVFVLVVGQRCTNSKNTSLQSKIIIIRFN